MVNWIIAAVMVFVAVNIIWFVLVPAVTGPRAITASKIPDALRAEVEEQLALGNTTRAAQVLSEGLGVGRRKAAHAVKNWPPEEPKVTPTPARTKRRRSRTARHVDRTPPTPLQPSELPPAIRAEIEEHLAHGRRLDAVQAYRRATEIGVSDGLRIIDAWPSAQ